jgi:hypothetical protein
LLPILAALKLSGRMRTLPERIAFLEAVDALGLDDSMRQTHTGDQMRRTLARWIEASISRVCQNDEPSEGEAA